MPLSAAAAGVVAGVAFGRPLSIALLSLVLIHALTLLAGLSLLLILLDHLWIAVLQRQVTLHGHQLTLAGLKVLSHLEQLGLLPLGHLIGLAHELGHLHAMMMRVHLALIPIGQRPRTELIGRHGVQGLVGNLHAKGEIQGLEVSSKY